MSDHDTSCTIATAPPDLPVSDFIRTYQVPGLPVVIRNATSNSSAAFRAMVSVERLATDWGDRVVTLSSANAFSYGRRRVSVREYLGTMHSISWDTAADEIFYLFGEHGEELQPLLDAYPLPKYATPDACLVRGAFSARGRASSSACTRPALSFGVAADGSGVPFHFHNDGFSESLHGRKLWLLYPDEPPRFHANMTSASWLRLEHPLLHAHERPSRCVIAPGDLLYFPKGWWHATVNVGTSVFMSTFL